MHQGLMVLITIISWITTSAHAETLLTGTIKKVGYEGAYYYTDNFHDHYCNIFPGPEYFFTAVKVHELTPSDETKKNPFFKNLDLNYFYLQPLAHLKLTNQDVATGFTTFELTLQSTDFLRIDMEKCYIGHKDMGYLWPLGGKLLKQPLRLLRDQDNTEIKFIISGKMKTENNKISWQSNYSNPWFDISVDKIYDCQYDVSLHLLKNVPVKLTT